MNDKTTRHLRENRTIRSENVIHFEAAEIGVQEKSLRCLSVTLRMILTVGCRRGERLLSDEHLPPNRRRSVFVQDTRLAGFFVEINLYLSQAECGVVFTPTTMGSRPGHQDRTLTFGLKNPPLDCARTHPDPGWHNPFRLTFANRVRRLSTTIETVFLTRPSSF